MAGPTYCFDTSALTQWWSRDYPPDVLPGLVSRMEQLIADGRAHAPAFVRVELERQDDQLSRWARAQDGFFLDEAERVQEHAAALLGEHHNPAKPAKGINGADPFVIALAAAHDPPWIVVSDEKPGSFENPKIPFVCQKIGLVHIRFLDLMRGEGWKLS